jgi:penicillin amidase
MEVETQGISVRGDEPVEVELKFTRHGPVIREEPEKGVAFAVRAAWLEPGMAPISALWTACARKAGISFSRR